MKKQIFLFLTVVLVFAASAAAQVANKTKAIEPTAKEALKIILANGDMPLSVDSSCKDVGAAKSDKTILDYLSGLLSFQTEPNSSNQIDFAFKREKGKSGALLWVCDLMFRGKDAEGEAEWSWGVRFKIRNSDRKLLRDSVTCPGSG